MVKSHPLGFAGVFATALLLGSQGCSPPGAGDRPSPAAAPTQYAVSKSAEPAAVTLTQKAAAVIRQYIAEQPQGSKLYMRVRVVPGGCKGFMHKIDLDSDVSADDHVGESAGVSVIASKRQLKMLQGTQVDFAEENGEQGFKVENPNFKGEGAKKWLAVLDKQKDIK